MSSSPNWSPLPFKDDPTHKVLLLLRGLMLAGGLLWTTAVADPADALRLLLLMAAFVVYSLILTGIFLWTAVTIDTVYRIAMPCDAAFIFVFIQMAGDRGIVVVPLYGLLVGLHAYYFGLKTGLTLAGLCTVLLAIHSQTSPIFTAPLELLFVAAFLGQIGGSLGWLSERQRKRGQQMEELIQELQHQGRALNQSEKIAILGRLTSSIAHEINNPISSILTRLECMLQDAQDAVRNGHVVDDLQVLLRQTRRLAQISGRLLRFARPASSVPEWIDVNASIERAVQWIEHRLPQKQLMLNLNLSSHLPKVRGSAGDLEEAVMNLLTNAIDACPPSGQIYVISALSGGRRKTIQILVADTGNGIDPAHRDQLFDPFFTTKAIGSGTGLGLFITRQIVREHLGTIEVDTEPGKGTTFIISLPVPSA